MGYGQFSPCRYEIIGRTADSATMTNCTANASANTKGNYATIGTTGFAYSGFYFLCRPQTGAGIRYRIDVAVNTGGSDAIIVEDLFHDASMRAGLNVWCPVRIPSGATVKTRCQSTTGSQTVACAFMGYMAGANGPPSYSRIIALTDWTNTDATNGVTLNGTTQTAWAQVEGSTAARVAALYVATSNRGDNTRTTVSLNFDIGRGGAGSEIKMFDLCAVNDGNTNIEAALTNQLGYPIWCDIPAGTALSTRAVASAACTDAFGITIHGLVP